MRLFQIQDTRDFMKKLLVTDTFDTFLLWEASVTTFCTFHIDGAYHPEFFSTDADSSSPYPYASWEKVRPLFWSLIKGKNTPLNFRIIFRLAPHNVEQLLKQSGVAMAPQDIDGLFLNLNYEKDSLTCTSGTSVKFFTLDKSLDHAWEENLEKFFRQKQIPFC
ncbi:MAG TPA: hypothetical protein IAB84_10860 [Candidatus Choladousia intestinigallinarum]|nr:hypothetical protein [Candidatus Choladousia intestinigallinarum]